MPAGQSFSSPLNDVVITAYDDNNNIKTDYTGEAYFTSTDGSAALPYTLSSKYTFTSGTDLDNGVHTFAGTGFTLNTTGTQTITLTDGSISVTSGDITVKAGVLDHFTFAYIGNQKKNKEFFITITATDTNYDGKGILTIIDGRGSGGATIEHDDKVVIKIYGTTNETEVNFSAGEWAYKVTIDASSAVLLGLPKGDSNALVSIKITTDNDTTGVSNKFIVTD